MKVILISVIFEHMIHRFLKDRGGTASRDEIYKALGDDEGRRRNIDEKLRMMERFGFVIIDGEEVKLK